ncbi:MAG: type II toxin-antitoxin system RelE/ParE family toxin [Tissierellia bacterium]|nr:type II toxin-antitoxin system RelE/ParE family toxin [Tissierellia bacterium]
MYKLNLSELAHHDLDRIVSYITVNLASPIAATNFLDQVEKCYDYLKNNPYTYAKCQNIRLEKEGYCKIPIKNYLKALLITHKYKTKKISVEKHHLI